MSNNDSNLELLLEVVGRLATVEQKLDDAFEPEKGWTPVFLATPYTNTDFDGDSFSTVAANTKIENTAWSTAIPANAKALILRIDVRDLGSAANNCWFGVYNAVGAVRAALICRPYGKPDDARASAHGVVPCTDGDIWYQCLASGADTLDAWIWCLGYWT